MVQTVSRRHLTAKARLLVRFIHVEFVALEQDFLRVLRFFSVNIIIQWFSVLLYHVGMNNRHVGGHSVEALSPHPHDHNLCILLKVGNVIYTMFMS
jgi:hypothetical protein